MVWSANDWNENEQKAQKFINNTQTKPQQLTSNSFSNFSVSLVSCQLSFQLFVSCQRAHCQVLSFPGTFRPSHSWWDTDPSNHFKQASRPYYQQHTTWNDHVDSLVKKAARKIYFLVQLKRARVPAEDLVAYYCACIRSSLDYACPVFHYSLPQYLQSDLERVQKRALACIFPRMPYGEPLERACLTSIREHHEDITKSLFRSISENQNSKLHHLTPEANSPHYILKAPKNVRSTSSQEKALC